MYSKGVMLRLQNEFENVTKQKVSFAMRYLEYLGILEARLETDKEFEKRIDKVVKKANNVPGLKTSLTKRGRRRKYYSVNKERASKSFGKIQPWGLLHHSVS